MSVRSPPERRSSIPLHRKRLEAAVFVVGHELPTDNEPRLHRPQLMASDIDEELDNDDDDDDVKTGGRAGTQFTYDVTSVSTWSSERNEATIINSFYNFVSRYRLTNVS